jgi:nicotinamidase-related amidase
MPVAMTLFQMAGVDVTPAKLDHAALLLIDCQHEYRAGPLALSGIAPAVGAAARLLGLAREAGTPVIHVAHKGQAGGLFDRSGSGGQIITELSPTAGEPVVEKGLPNAFAGTDLQTRLAATGRKEVIIVGFMTHNCVSSTARAALDLGYRVTIDASCCATRPLPDGKGGEIPAETVHQVALVELSDRTAIVAWTPIRRS